MAERTDMIVPRLREMRFEVLNERDSTRALQTVLNERLGSVEGARKTLGQVLLANSLMRKLVTKEFAQRIAALEQRVHELEMQK
jgi:hypothetical protein